MVPTVSNPQSTTARSQVPADEVRPLTRLGAWDLVRLVGEGQLASVYQARPTGSATNQPACYAVKVLRPQWQDDLRGISTLAREVQVGRKVTNPHLVPILAGQLDHSPYYLAMPLLDGTTLCEYLKLQPQIDLPVAFWIVRQVAEALDALHQAGWMHSDVKPSNIFVSPTGHVTLFDLGFARHADECSSIADRVVLGTVNYMAPEMLSSSAGGDTRSDVYSLGVALFEILTGRLPFDGDDIGELAAHHRQDLPGDVRAQVPHLPTRAARLVHRMLAKDALRRPLPREVIDRLIRLEVETFDERYAVAYTLDTPEIKPAAALDGSSNRANPPGARPTVFRRESGLRGQFATSSLRCP